MSWSKPIALGVTVVSAVALADAAKKLPLSHRRDPVAGITTAGQLTPEDIRALPTEGFKTVINLRPPKEPGALADEAEQVAKAGMQYVSLPVAGADDVTEANARALAAELAKPGRLPAVVHCASANRVGALLALKAFYVDGKDVPSAVDLGKQAGLAALEPAVRATLEAAQAARKKAAPAKP